MTRDSIKVRVQLADALTSNVDVLVLKYAQASYGLDQAVAVALGVERHQLPADGEHLLIRGRPKLGADYVLFLGVQQLHRFEYKEIRKFGERALAVTSQLQPNARTIGLTVHGPGYGLDEIESFESELAGIVDAVSVGAYPPGLAQLEFIEYDEGRHARLGRALQAVLPDGRLSLPGHAGSMAAEASAARLRNAGLDAGSRSHAFVAMPFDSTFDDIFHYAIAQPVRNAGLLCERMDQLVFYRRHRAAYARTHRTGGPGHRRPVHSEPERVP